MNQVTLATLGAATEQEVFDQVATHLLAQGRRAARGGNEFLCSYRTDDGLKCAAGCLIGDGEYSPDLEDKSWTWLIREGKVPTDHARLITELQEIHDTGTASTWRERLYKVASSHGLKADVVGVVQ